MPLLYQYVRPGGGDGASDLPPQLLTMTLLASDPCSFNDPFEVRPYFDQERHDYFAKSYESFYEKTLGIKHSLIAGRSMVGDPTEKAVGFGETLNKRYRQEISKRFRVACLSRTRGNSVMWGHYASSHRGFVIGIDTNNLAFPKGLNSDGFDIKYTSDRSMTKLPIAYYHRFSVESYDPYTGKITNSPHEPVINEGGLEIPFSEYRRRVEEAMLTSLTTKSQEWNYEQEVRFIYDLSKGEEQLLKSNRLHLISIPPDAFKEIIVGFRATAEDVRKLVELFRTGKIGKPKLFFAECHPYRYEVQAHETDANYLLDYFQTILPSQGTNG
jgi:hypothetical protein